MTLLILSGCATPATNIGDFGTQLLNNITRNVYDDKGIHLIQPYPANLLLVSFDYDHGILKDAVTVQSSGSPVADARALDLVLRSEVPSVDPALFEKRQRYFVAFCFLPSAEACQYLQAHTDIAKLIKDYDEQHGTPQEDRGIKMP